MTDAPAEDLRAVFGAALTEAAADAPGIRLAETPAVVPAFDGFRSRWPDRRGAVDSSADLEELLGRAASRGHSAYLAGPAERLVPPLYSWMRARVPASAGACRLVATRSGLAGVPPHGEPPVLDDLAVMSGLPGMTVLAPSDGPSTRQTVHWLVGSDRPAYVRLTELPAPAFDGPGFELGRARLLREGSDLGLIAVGSMVGLAMQVAGELAQVGVSGRVLDLASVKPMDLKAILRAARDTGALLTLEDHLVGNGIGAQVAALTSENYPVPVHRIGIPDLAGPAGAGAVAMDSLGLSHQRVVDEAWELLRLKGKVQ